MLWATEGLAAYQCQGCVWYDSRRLARGLMNCGCPLRQASKALDGHALITAPSCFLRGPLYSIAVQMVVELHDL